MKFTNPIGITGNRVDLYESLLILKEAGFGSAKEPKERIETGDMLIIIDTNVHVADSDSLVACNTVLHLPSDWSILEGLTPEKIDQNDNIIVERELFAKMVENIEKQNVEPPWFFYRAKNKLTSEI